MKTVAVIDYGMGNLHSVAKALEQVAEDTRVIVTADSNEILAADRAVLPGVGAMRDCMGEMKRLGIDQVARQFAETKPLLGVCVGMQAMFDSSEENNGVDCLGLLPGKVLAFDTNMTDPNSGERLKVPHMGWNRVHHALEEHPMWNFIEDGAHFYFVHSYYVEPADPNLIAGFSTYPHAFTAAVTKDNVFAVQFHPEKSQAAGLQLYANFLKWNGNN
ncbi:MAG: imidazole glycerol phosphate synthase subunit HisH [Gammaproteobacteria bacterium]|nr:imidazole glycerol phosphate synthase subunit HisH [Gammaproteobacteria bacterium]